MKKWIILLLVLLTGCTNRTVSEEPQFLLTEMDVDFSQLRVVDVSDSKVLLASESEKGSSLPLLDSLLEYDLESQEKSIVKDDFDEPVHLYDSIYHGDTTVSSIVTANAATYKVSIIENYLTNNEKLVEEFETSNLDLLSKFVIFDNRVMYSKSLSIENGIVLKSIIDSKPSTNLSMGLSLDETRFVRSIFSNGYNMSFLLKSKSKPGYFVTLNTLTLDETLQNPSNYGVIDTERINHFFPVGSRYLGVESRFDNGQGWSFFGWINASNPSHGKHDGQPQIKNNFVMKDIEVIDTESFVGWNDYQVYLIEMQDENEFSVIRSDILDDKIIDVFILDLNRILIETENALIIGEIV